MCVFTVELEVCDGFDNGIYTSASCAATLTLRSGSFFSVLNPRSKTVLHFPSVPCQPNAIKLSRCVQFQVFHVNRTLSSCEDVWRTRMHPSVAIEMWIGIPGLRKEKPKGVVASWWGEHPKASRYRQSLVSHHHWWGVHHFGCHSHQKKTLICIKGAPRYESVLPERRALAATVWRWFESTSCQQAKRSPPAGCWQIWREPCIYSAASKMNVVVNVALRWYFGEMSPFQKCFESYSYYIHIYIYKYV